MYFSLRILRLNTCFVVLLLVLNPDSFSAIISSAWPRPCKNYFHHDFSRVTETDGSIVLAELYVVLFRESNNETVHEIHHSTALQSLLHQTSVMVSRPA